MTEELRQNALIELLEDCEEYFDQRADAEFFTDSAGGIPNEEMKLLVKVRNVKDRMNSEISALREDNAALREALEAFVATVDNIHPDTMKAYDKARALLAKQKDNQ